MSYNIKTVDFTFGDQRLVGQQMACEQLTRIIQSGRISHAYLFSGPRGVGKTAFALAFAEIINGVDNLTDLRGEGVSKKSTWFTHPDIHLFLPIPTNVDYTELRSRLQLLKEDPYEIVDFGLRPSIDNDSESGRNRFAFYSISYLREEIKPVARLKPNEGIKTVVILKDVENMRAKSSNAFLKLLEEPTKNLVFILTTQNTESLLPTIISRCQHIRFTPLKTSDIERALIEMDHLPEDEARYLARISGGNYSMTRFYDTESLKVKRQEIVTFLRNAYAQNAVDIIQNSQDWQSDNNLEGIITLLNIMEVFLRDLMVYRDTGREEMLTNADQMEIIKNFCATLKDADLEMMIQQVQEVKPMIYQNVQPKLVFAVLSLRFFHLMRGQQPDIIKSGAWKHLPALNL